MCDIMKHIVGTIKLDDILKNKLISRFPNVSFCDIKSSKRRIFPIIISGIELTNEEETLYKMFRCSLIYAFNTSLKNIIDLVNNAIRNESELSSEEKGYANVIDNFQYLNEKIEAIVDENNHHSLKVANIMNDICEKLHLDHERTLDLYMGALMHDIGKVYVNPNYLAKKGKLTKEEYDNVKTHSLKGYEMMKGYLKEEIREMIRDHHKRENGGYPIDELNASRWSKMLALSDSYDAMTSKRIYNIPISKEEGIDEIIKCTKDVNDGGKGALFDPYLSELFIKIIA